MKWYKPDFYRDYLAKIGSRNPRINWELVRQIGACQAWIVRDTANNRVCLQSYSTIVSYVTDTGTPVRLGKWTTTTSKHQTLFDRIFSTK